MLTRNRANRRTTDLIVIASVYAIALAGSYAFVRGSLDAEAGFPDLRKGAAALLFGLAPLAMVAVLAVSGFRFAKEYRRRAWGYRLRARALGAFALVAAMSALPPMLMLGELSIRAVEAPASAAVRSALRDGLAQSLSYYAAKEAGLKYAAENDVPRYVAAGDTDAVRVLARLSARDPSVRAVELMAGGAVVSYAGDPAARTSGRYAAMERSGFLPRLSISGVSHARYFVRDAGYDAEGRRISAVVTARFPEELEDAAASISEAIAALERQSPIGRGFRSYVAYYVASLVFPLAALAFLFAMDAADGLLHPVAALSDSIRRVAAGARRAPFLAKPGDEAGDVVDQLNSLLDSLERARGDELRSEKIGAWRDIARKLAHELRNPLTPIRLSAERVLKRWKADPAAAGDIIERSMVAIVQETINMEALLSEFRDFARLPEPQRDWMELRPTVDEVAHLYSASMPGVSIDCSGVDPAVVLKADRGYLKQALGNLLANAGEAGAARIWILAELVKTAESRYCRIEVRDDGRGIPPDVRDMVFTPYFTTKEGGTGLGLAIVEHIVAAHGGKIRFESTEGAGTVFYVDLPAEGGSPPYKEKQEWAPSSS